SFEFLRNPIYRIVDEVSISSDGPVYSVVVAHRGKVGRIKEIELDPASETSANLLRCLIAELGLNARLVRRSTAVWPGAAGPKTGHRARLLIGDQAIRFRQEYANEFSFWDLGKQWQKPVGLPFVYALWLIRPEVADPKQIANRLRALRNENLDNLDHLIPELVVGVAEPGRGPQRDSLANSFPAITVNIFDSALAKKKKKVCEFSQICASNIVCFQSATWRSVLFSDRFRSLKNYSFPSPRPRSRS